MTPRENIEPSTSPAPKEHRSMFRRRFLVLAGSLVGVVALCAALLLIAPRHAARFIANHYLQGMQIDAEGVKTIDVDLLNGEISMGPVRFHSGTADPGSIGRLGVKLSLGNLFAKKALLQSVILRDVSIAVRQTEDGEILINGIPLRRFLAEKAAEPSAPPPERSPSGWGAGVDDMRLRDVHLHFANRYGGTADLEIGHLDLRGFRSWQPDQPGVFVLSGAVNGIEVNAYGYARPFAEKVTADAEIGVDRIGLRNVEQYVGPLGLDRADGTLSIYARPSVAVFPNGRLEGSTEATLGLAGIDVSMPSRGAIKLDHGSIIADARFLVDEAGVTAASGKADAKFTKTSGRLPNGTAVSLSSAGIGLANLDASLPGGGALSFACQPRIEADQPTLSGPVEFRAEKLAIDAPGMTVRRGGDGRLSARLDASPDDRGKPRLELRKPALAGPIRGSAETLALELLGLALDGAVDGGTTAKTGATLSAKTIAVELAPAGAEARRFAADTLSVDLPSLSAEAKAGVSIDSKGDARLSKLSAFLPAAGGQQALEIAADGARLNLAELKLNGTRAAETRLDATIEAALNGLAGSWRAEAAPQTEVPGRARTKARGAAPSAPTGAAGRFAANDFTVGLAPVGLRFTPDGLSGSGSTSATVDGLSASVPANPVEAPYDVSASRLRIGLNGIDLQSRSGESALSGKLETSLDGFRATQSAPPGSAGAQQTRLTADGLRLALAPATVRMRGDQLSVSAAGTTALGRLTAMLPKAPGRPAVDLAVAGVRANSTDLGFESATPAPHWRTRLDAQVEGITSKSDGGNLFSAKVKTISVGDLRADDQMRIAIDRIVIDQPDASISNAYITEVAAHKESRPQQAAEAAQQGASQGATFALNSFSVSGGGTLRLRDVSRTPPANFTLQVKALQLQNMDSANPNERMPVRLEATLNDYTEVAVNGWAAPFGNAPGFNLDARVRSLELPPLSSYAAKAIGLNIEGGRLSAEASAAADAGKLNGVLELTLRDLDFSPLSKADAERISASVGVPVETVVGLLQDDQGRIQLRLPVSGDLRSPSFDFGDAIRQALAGAVQAAVLAPFQLAFAPVALIARAAGGDSSQVGLKPIPFDPGSAELNSTGRDMANGLVRVLQQRDKLKLKVCGRATADDLAQALGGQLPPVGPERQEAADRLGDKMHALASERTATVRKALIEGSGAKPWQVGECRSAFELADTGPPRAEISF
jgi:hypothetical protein